MNRLSNRVCFVGLSLLYAALSVQATVTILDDEDAGVTLSGGWAEEAAGYNNDEWYQALPENGATATYSFTGLATGNYYVSASWFWASWAPNRTTTAVYDMTDGIPSVTLNQNTNTSWGFDDDSDVMYGRLSSFGGYVAYTVSDGTLEVTVSDSDTVPGLHLMADSVRLETAPPDVEKVYVIDNEDATGYSQSGTWYGTWGGNTDHFANYAFSDQADAVATFNFTGLEDGVYRVSATWKDAWNNATNAAYAIAGVGSVAVNQRDWAYRPTQDLFENVYWNDLFERVTVSGGSLTVTLTNLNPGANLNLFSDAVRVEKLRSEPYRFKNWSFEADTLADNLWTGTPASWAVGGAGGAINPWGVPAIPAVPNGVNVGYVYNGGTLWQSLETTEGAPLAPTPGDQITISFEACGAYSSSGNVLADIRTPGGVSIVGGAQSQPIGVDAYATCTYTFRINTFEPMPRLVLEGEGNDGGTYAMVDKVRMSFRPVMGTVFIIR